MESKVALIQKRSIEGRKAVKKLERHEDSISFETILRSLTQEFQPQSGTEELLLQRIAIHWLRLRRLWIAEGAIVDENRLRTERAVRFPGNLKSAEIILERWGMSDPKKAELERLEQDIDRATIASSMMANSEKLARLSQEEMRITRELDLALDRLASIQQKRQDKV